MDIAFEKTRNEVIYWLKEHGRTLGEDALDELARRALHLYTDTDYSSLENAVEDVLEAHFEDGDA